MTKNWRLPGWRIGWVVGPKKVIEIITCAGSFLDGGTNNPLQLSCLPYMKLDFIKKDVEALQKHFKAKRDFVVSEIEKLGILVPVKPNATFYVWADLSKLPSPINDGIVFFEECLKENVIVVPGIFFHLSPRSLRKNLNRSRYSSYIRISFGPPFPQLERGIKGFQRVVAKFNK